ncbi:class I SAM-dependent methyltransferase, partial [Patescibacteria group bacterium]|nr:class I SAM-dependent methyltransferase [Patescibacteria group bacterium]
DYNLGMLELAAEYYPDLPFQQENIYNLSFPDRSFDVVMSGACIIHVKDWKRAVSEIARVAKVFLFLHRNSMRAETVLESFRAYDTELYHWHFNEDDLLGAALGFSLVETYDLSHSGRSYLLRRQK